MGKFDGKESVPKSLDNYQIGEQIAKGGFGTVHRGLNSDTGAAVAIKRISLENIPEDELNSIQMEIDLLKELEHEHIVQYVGSHKTKDHLYIILDFVENGSLSAAVKKFGTFKEQLVASYTYQTLIGLAYLHAQGVIHRDIKGANILTTKDGTVKLADFGVATKDGGAMDDNDVVGTPYWMAPEIIEMSGASTKSDIWSVGCTIIELLTGSPPYFDLAPMPALFRIVQDPMPPLPDGISPALKEFLNLCFRKEPERRASAQDLLAHRWLKEAMKRYEEGKGKKLSVTKEQIPDKEKKGEWSEVAKSTVEKFQGGIFFRKSVTEKPKELKEAAAAEEEEEDWDDIDLEEPASVSRSKSTSEKNLATAKKTLKGITLGNSSMDLTDGFDGFDDDEEEEAKNTALAKKGAPVTLAVGAHLASLTVEDKLEKLAESDGDMDFDFDQPIERPKSVSKKSIAGSGSISGGDNGDIDWQAFEEAEDGAEEDNARMQKEAEEGEFEKLIDLLEPTTDAKILVNACTKIEEKLRSNPRLKEGFIVHHGVIPILEMLESAGVQMRSAILKVVALLVDGNTEVDKKLRLNLCLTGLISFLLQFADPSSQIHLRALAARIIETIIVKDDMALQLLIGCRGLSVLVGFLEPDYAVMKEIALIGVRCLWRTFQMRSATPKSDLCRLLLPSKAPYRLLATLQNLMLDRGGPEIDVLINHTIEMIGYFCHSDEIVKTAVAAKGPLEVFLSVLERTGETDRLMKLLKYFKDLSGGRASTLDLLEDGGAIETIVKVAQSPIVQGSNPQMMNMILFSLSRLCSIKMERLEKAVKAGAVPILLREIKHDGQMKNVAFDVVCGMARSGSKIMRKEFEKHGAVEVIVETINNGWMGLDALGALGSLVSHGDKGIVDVVRAESCLEKIGTAINEAETWMMEKLTESVLKLVENSTAVNRAIGGSAHVLPHLLRRMHRDEGVVLTAIMRIIRYLYRDHQHPKSFIKNNNLLAVLKGIAENQTTVMARKIADDLLASFSTDYLI